jgi:ribose transport system permease protein
MTLKTTFGSFKGNVLRLNKGRSWVDMMPIATLVLLLFVMAIGSPRFLTTETIIILLAQSATLIMMGIGETFIILLGSIDLSIAPVAAMATIIAAMLVPSLGYLAFVIAVIFGASAGLVTGLIHTKGRIPSFIASLGTMGIWTGLSFLISNATPVNISTSNGRYLTWITGDMLGIPNTIYIMAVVLMLTFFLENYTAFGRYVKAIGAGEKATYVAGGAIDLYKTLAFVLCGALAAFQGVIITGIMSSGSARATDGLQMKAIAIVVLGGTAVSGGIGGVLRTFIGALIVFTLEYGMNMVGVNSWFQQAVYGAIIILAVALTIDRSRISIIK